MKCPKCEEEIPVSLTQALQRGLVIGVIAVLLAIAVSCKSEVKERVTVVALDGYAEATKSAMKQLNGYIGCDFLQYQVGEGPAQITLRSETGEPCGKLLWQDTDEEWRHSAAAYACGERVGIMISAPGHINTQAFIAAHEIGHGLGHFLGEGFEHSTIGIMSKPKDPNSREQNYIRVRDADVKIAKDRFCK